MIEFFQGCIHYSRQLKAGLDCFCYASRLKVSIEKGSANQYEADTAVNDKKMNLLSMQANDNDSIDYLMENKRTSTKFEKTLLDKVMDSPFEDRTYKIPEASHQILSAIYGDDFMEIPPVEKRVKHDDFVAYIKEV